MKTPLPLRLDVDQLAIYQGAERICTLETRAGIRAQESASWGDRLVYCHNEHDPMLAMLMELETVLKAASKAGLLPAGVIGSDLAKRHHALLVELGGAA